MEKRALIRSCVQASVVCSLLTTSIPAKASNGTMLNCSRSGVCIVLNRNIEIGSIVMIKADGKFSKENQVDPAEGFRTIALAEVKWVKPLDGKEICYYTIGLRYLPI